MVTPLSTTAVSLTSLTSATSVTAASTIASSMSVTLPWATASLATTSGITTWATSRPQQNAVGLTTTMTSVTASVPPASATTDAVTKKPFKVRKPVYLPPTNLSERKSRARKRKKFADEVVESSSSVPAAPSSAVAPAAGSEQVSKIGRKADNTALVTSGEHHVRPGAGGISSSGGISKVSPASVVGSSKNTLAQSRSRRLSAGRGASVTSATTTQATTFMGPKQHVMPTTTSRHVMSRGIAVRPRLPLVKPSTKKGGKDKTGGGTGGAGYRGKQPHARSAAPTGSSKLSRSVKGEDEAGKDGTGSGARILSRKLTSRQQAKNRMRQMKELMIKKENVRWKAVDDLALITSVIQTCNLHSVYTAVKFTTRFSFEEIKERWTKLLYDQTLSAFAMSRIGELDDTVIEAVERKTLFSKKEEDILADIPGSAQQSTSQPTLAVFREALQKHADVFHRSRTPLILYNHWMEMKHHQLLCDQRMQRPQKTDAILNFSEAEELLNDVELAKPRDEAGDVEVAYYDHNIKAEIRQLENELPKWQAMLGKVTGSSAQEFDSQTLAVLRGRLVRYLMRSREITLGRNPASGEPGGPGGSQGGGAPVDVDLSLEGPAMKISRRQGVIKMHANGQFYLVNEGKRPFFVDGKPLLSGNRCKLYHNAVVEISCLRFIFLINKELISTITVGDMPGSSGLGD